MPGYRKILGCRRISNAFERNSSHKGICQLLVPSDTIDSIQTSWLAMPATCISQQSLTKAFIQNLLSLHWKRRVEQSWKTHQRCGETKQALASQIKCSARKMACYISIDIFYTKTEVPSHFTSYIKPV